jgi:hypothetical protein
MTYFLGYVIFLAFSAITALKLPLTPYTMLAMLGFLFASLVCFSLTPAPVKK